jgi:hypothetical protein
MINESASHHQAKISVCMMPALKLGDEFMASGDFQQDAEDLCVIYGIEDAKRVTRYLMNPIGRAAFDFRALAAHQREHYPRRNIDYIANFISDCRLSKNAYRELISD